MRHPSLNRRTFLPRIALLVLLAVGCGGNDARPAVSDAHLSGEHILFASDTDGDWEIFAMLPDGSYLRRLTNNQARDWAAEWSPDGKRFVFSSNYLEGGLTTTKQEINGEYVMVDVEVVGDYELRVAKVEDQIGTAITDNQAGTDGGPDWSPDGSRIAFHSDPDGSGVSEIYSMRPDGADVVQMTDLGGMNWDPSWSPDGQNIVFAHFSDAGEVSKWSLYSVRADGTEVTALEEAGDGWQPSWSGSGDQIAFSSRRDGSWNIYVVDADGGNLVRLTNNEGDNLEPVWSPSGDRIAFGSSRQGTFKVFVMDSDGGNVVATGRTGFPSSWVAQP